MSQQAQAVNQHQQGLQDWSEIQANVDSLRARFDAGGITKEALDAEVETLNHRAEAAERYFDEATRLDTLNARSRTLAERARQPQFSRPRVESESVQEDPPAPADPQVEALMADRAKDLEPGGTARNLLNRFLRPKSKGGGQGALSDKGWEYLTLGRRAAGSQFLSGQRGEMLSLTPYVDASGGYVQAEEIAAEILQIRDRATDLESRVNRKTIRGTRLTIPTMKVEIPFEKRGRGRGATATAIDLRDILGRTALTVNKKDALLKIPEEFFEDPDFDAVGEIARASERDSREEDERDMLVGDGSGEPLGIATALLKLYADGATQVAVTPAAGASAVSAEEVESFDTFLPSTSLSNAVYVMNRPGIRKVRLMRTDVGGAGTGDFLFKRSNTAGGLPLLLEKEVVTSEFLPDTITSGSEGDLMWMLIDLMDYWWVVQKELSLRVLEELFAQEHMVGYQWVKNRDGSLVRGDAALYMRRGPVIP